MKNLQGVFAMVVAGAILGLPTATAQDGISKTVKRIEEGRSVTTETLNGTVEYVQGNHLVVRMADSSIREFTVPNTRKFIIDGREVGVNALQIGTALKATVTTTTKSLVERTHITGTGTVFYVSGNTVILTFPGGENRTFTVKDNFQFLVDGKKATAQDLRPGMKASGDRIVEMPMTEISSNTIVTGQAPKPASKTATKDRTRTGN